MKIRTLAYAAPILLLILIGVLYHLDAERLSNEDKARQLALQLGIPRQTVEEYASKFPELAETGELARYSADDPHDHELPVDFAIQDTGVEMVFAHLGSGSIANTERFLQFSIVLINDSNRTSTGSIQFFDDSGEPMEVPFDGEPVAEIPFELFRGQMQQFTSDGPGEIRSGWALVQSDQPVSGTLSFGIRDANGTIFTDVGVPPSPVGTEFTIFADTLLNSDTGVGLSNPNTAPVDIDFQLLDTEGEMVDSTSRQMAPKGHLALFLSQLFSGVPGIEEFEGSVLIRTSAVEEQTLETASQTGEAPAIAGVTLRVTGNQLTSLPVVEPPPGNANWSTLVFPHMAVGQGGGLEIVTSSILFNNTASPTAGNVEYFDSAGNPISVMINGEEATSAPFSLQPGGVARLMASSTEEIKTGWIRVNGDQPIAGTNLFTIFDARQRVISEVGVPSAILQKNFNLIADSTGVFDTGLALSFALSQEEEGERLGSNTKVYLNLYDSDGYYVEQTEIDLLARGHQALFLTELFPEVEGIEEFQGFLKASSDDYVGVVSLRSAGAKVTSVPLFDFLRGFSPLSTVLPSQSLAGTAPAMKWTVHQSSDDLALDQLEVLIRDASLNEESITAGQKFALGTFLQPRLEETRLFHLLAREVPNIEFDLVTVREAGLIPQGSGHFRETDAGVEIFVDFGADPDTYIGGSADWSFYLPADLVQLPTEAEEAVIETRFSSVQSFKLDDNLIMRETSEIIPLRSNDRELQLHSVSSSFLLPGNQTTLTGEGFTEEMTVEIFTPDNFSTVLPTDVTETSCMVLIPPNIRPTGMRLRDFPNESNPLTTYTLFSPYFRTRPTEDDLDTELDETGFMLETFLSLGDLSLGSIQFISQGLDVDISSFTIGQEVGAFEARGGEDTHLHRLFVSDLDEDSLVLEAKQAVDSESPSAKVTIIPDQTAPDRLRFSLEWIEPIAEPVLLYEDFRLALSFFTSSFPLGEPLVPVEVIMTSAPLFSGSSSPGYKVSALGVLIDEEAGQ